jgi:endonuclease/exonuclease/phosphatase family metal-dependent hydrolase
MTALVLRLVSINIWDLPVPVPGLDRTLRRERLRAQLPRQDADLVLLQEAFVPGFRRTLLSSLPEYHADARALERRRHWLISMDGAGGLLTLSRWPIRRTVYQPARRFRSMKPDERIGRKGTLWTDIETPLGPLLVGNLHLYAGNRPIDARVRAVQVRQTLGHPLLREGIPTVLAGDFNMAAEFEQPSRGPSGFDLLGAHGFVEIAGGFSPGLMTMAPSKKRYARYAPWHRPDRRLTHVFYCGSGLRRGPEPPALCLHAPPVSDHFGLRVTLTLAGD